jgi:hypothetical protein
MLVMISMEDSNVYREPAGDPARRTAHPWNRVVRPYVAAIKEA